MLKLTDLRSNPGNASAVTPRKPAGLVYGSDETPPLAITIISAVQHVGVIAIFMIYPLIIARTAGVGADDVGAICAGP